MLSPICPHCNQRKYVRFVRVGEHGKEFRCFKCHKAFSIPLLIDGKASPPPPTIAVKKFYCFGHQGKENALLKVLRARGYAQTQTPTNRTDLVLSDAAILGRVTRFETMHRVNPQAPIIVFPHAARPDLTYDAFSGSGLVTATLVVSDEHAEILRIIGHKEPLHPIGWSICPVREFTPRSPENVLFAPIHPRNSAMDKKVNQATFDKLLPLARAGRIKLTVRFIPTMEENGIAPVEHPNITYTSGSKNGDYSDAELTGVVVSHQTYAWMAVALGVPTVMMAEDMPTHWEPSPGKLRIAKTWDAYKHLLKYPLDILAIEDTMKLLERAASTDEDVRDWKRRMIGEPFDGDRFMQIVESYL